MKFLQVLLLQLLFIASVFCISTRFTNPTEPTCYMAIAGCFLLVLVELLCMKKGSSWSLSISEFVLTGIVIWMTVNGSFAPDNTLLGIALVTFYVWGRRVRVNTRLLFPSIALFGVVQTLYGLGQYIHWLPNIVAPTFRISGCFNNPSGFAATLVVCFPFVLYFARLHTTFLRWLIIAVCITMVTGVILAQSRAGVVAIVVIIMISGFRLVPNTIWLKYGLKTKITAVVFLIAVLLAFLYFVKKDSADGRLLIWQCSLQMFADKPLTGHNTGAFQRDYMLYQADYFKHHPDSKYVMLADIVKHPFNEYLLLIIEQGIVGFVLFIGLAGLVVRTYCRAATNENHSYMLCLTGIGILACFSYPFAYPFVKLAVVFSTSAIMQTENRLLRFHCYFVKLTRLALVTCVLVLAGTTGKLLSDEYRWNIIAWRSLTGETREVLPLYASLYHRMQWNTLFIYNYAAELNYIGEWKKSNIMMQQCLRMYNDNDVQLILADNYIQLRQYNQAEQCLQLAHQMIPNRFIPLYRLVNLYKNTGQKNKARLLAQMIINKPIKVISPEVVSIKAEMREIVK